MSVSPSRVFERVYQAIDERQVRVRVEVFDTGENVYTLPGWSHSCSDAECPDVNAEAVAQLEQPSNF